VQEEHDDPRIGLVLIGFSPAARLGAIARHLGWTGTVLSDPDRTLYERLGIGRASWWRVWTPATLLLYARAWRRGQRPTPTTEDTRQLGGDALLVDGVVRRLWRPRSPDDRPPAAEVLAAARVLLSPGL
jgi:hypothetical protein